MSIFNEDGRRLSTTPSMISAGPDTGLVENTVAAWSATRHNDLAVSQELNDHDAWEAYRDEIYSATGQRLENPMIAPAGTERFAAPSVFIDPQIKKFQERAKQLHETLGGFDLKTPDDLKASIAERAATLEKRHMDVSDRQTGLGVVGEFAGMAGAVLTDPPVAMSLVVGAPVSAGILRTAAIEGLVAAGTEAVIQPKIQGYRDELGLDAGFERGLTNVLAAGGGGVLFGGGIKALGIFAGWGMPKVRQVYRDVKKNPTPEERGAVAASEREGEILSDNPLEDSPAGVSEHIERVEKSLEAVQEGLTAVIPDVAITTGRGVGSTPEGGVLGQFAPIDVVVDAERFQFKQGGDAQGVTERLEGVKEWDETKAGLTLLFEDVDGRMFVADGHQRVGLAKRLAARDPAADIRINGLVLRANDGISDVDVRRIAAAKNIAEGTGTAVDAAKVLRLAPGQDLNLPPRSALVHQAQDLTRLSPDAFGMVVNDVVPSNYAALVGRLVDDPELHASILGVVAKAEPANAVQAEAVVRQARAAGAVRETQESLFGEEEVTTSLFADRARILDKSIKLLRRDKAVFKTLVDEETKIMGAGANKLDADTNVKQETANARALFLIQKLAHSKGAVSDALTAAARRAREEGRDAGATRDFADAIRNVAGGSREHGGNLGGGGRGAKASRENPAEPIAEEWQAFDEPGGAGTTAQTDRAVSDLFDGPDSGDVPVRMAVDDTGEIFTESLTRGQMKKEIKADDDFLKLAEGCLS